MSGRILHRITASTRHRLLLGIAFSILVPAVIDVVAKAFIQPGLHDNAAKLAQMIDYMALGAVGFGLSTVATAFFGVMIVASMKGPGYVADGYESEAQAQSADAPVPADRRR